MNLSSFLKEGLLRTKYSNTLNIYEFRIIIARNLSLLEEGLSNGDRATIDTFENKLERFPGNEYRFKRSWYFEHIGFTPEYYISQLAIIALQIFEDNTHVHYKYENVKVIGLKPLHLFDMELSKLCKLAADQFTCDNISKEIDQAIYALYFDNKGTLMTPALKLLGFLFIVSGKLGLDLHRLIDYCLIYSHEINYKGTGNSKAPLNGKEVVRAAKKGTESKASERDKGVQFGG